MRAAAPEWVPKKDQKDATITTRTASPREPRGKKGKAKSNSKSDSKDLAMQLFSFAGDTDKSKDSEIDRSATGALKSHRSYNTKPSMTRAEFCMANNRFFVSPFLAGSDESLYNPDKLLSWEYVEGVKSMNDGEHACCICMSTLLIPQATKCGHIYCFTCVLRYLFYDDGESNYIAPSQKCPLCSQYISLKDLRPFQFLPDVAPAEEGKEFSLRLMSIEKGSMFAKVARSSNNNKVSPAKEKRKAEMDITAIVPSEESEDALFSRISLVTPEWIRRRIEADRDQLIHYRARCMAAGDSVETWEEAEVLRAHGEAPADVEYLPSIDQALAELEERERGLEDRWGKARARGVAFGASPKDGDLLSKASAATATGTGRDGEGGGEVELDLESGPCYFYQCMGGSFVFLHPICMKCLLTDAERRQAEAGSQAETPPSSLPSLPSLLSAKVVEVERVRVDASSRSRTPSLRHLPQHCDHVALIEIEMSSLVLPDTLSLFSEDLGKRRARRKKARLAEKRERRDDSDREIALALQQEELRQRHREAKEQEERDLADLKRGPRAGKPRSRSRGGSLGSASAGHSDTGAGENMGDTGAAAAAECRATGGASDSDDEEWPDIGVAAKVSALGEVHSFSAIATTMGYFPDLGSSPPLSEGGGKTGWRRQANDVGGAGVDGVMGGTSGGGPSTSKTGSGKKGKKERGEKMSLVYTFES